MRPRFEQTAPSAGRSFVPHSSVNVSYEALHFFCQSYFPLLRDLERIRFRGNVIGGDFLLSPDKAEVTCRSGPRSPTSVDHACFYILGPSYR